MFLLALIAVPVLEVFVFIEVGEAIGWLWALVLLIGTSVIGGQLLRIQGRLAIERVSLAIAGRGAPGRAALEGALGFLGCALLVIPGFVTDFLGLLLIFAPTRRVAARWVSRRYADRVLGFAQSAGRFAPGGFTPRRGPMGPADVESTAVEEDPDQLGR
jgi:UPF0716 protein FxsA